MIGDDVEADAGKSLRVILEANEAVCGRTKCRRRSEPSGGGRNLKCSESKKEAYKRWLQLKSAEAKE